MIQAATVENIWRDLHAELYNFIQSKVHKNELAEDLLQDVFIKVHLNLHTVTQPEKLTSWIYQITRNVIHDHFRNEKRSEDMNWVVAEEESNESLYDSLSNCINGKIQLLSTSDKQAVLLTYFESFSQKQLAEFLSISYSGAKNRVQRVRKKIETAILKCENVEVTASGELRRFIV